MPTSETCISEGQEISVATALELNSNHDDDLNSRPVFLCVDCGERVRPHRQGGHVGAHFEHYRKNHSCPLSYGDSYSPTGQNTSKNNPDSEEAIEGYNKERKLLTSHRNAAIVVACKERNNYTCQACGFQLRVNGRYVIECHHSNPLGTGGERVTSIDELECLCPTCHRIAHTAKPPLSIEQIRSIRNEL